MADQLSARAPAKINLCLEVLGRRADGYHEIRTIMQAVSLFDEIDLETRPGGQVVLSASGAGLPSPADNLVVQAARLLQRECACTSGVHIRLSKAIPIGGGLGGGSSDCAATLCALSDLWGLGLSVDDLTSLAARLGSDVPFFVRGGTALCEGRGERVRALSAEGAFHYVLVMPRESISTAEAYGAVDGGLTKRKGAGRIEEVQAALAAGDTERLGAALYNDLEVAAFRLNPRIRRIYQRFSSACQEVGCLGLSLSGSGSSMFGVFDTQELAREAAVRLAEQVNVPTRAVHNVSPGLDFYWSLLQSEDDKV